MEKTLPKILREMTVQYPKIPAQYSKNEKKVFQPVSYKELYEIALNFGGGLLNMGVVRGDHIGLISDNRMEWEQADMGLLAIGAIDVPRGCDATENDLRFILATAECKLVIAENPRQIERIVGLKDNLPDLNKMICFESYSDELKEKAAGLGVTLYTFQQIVTEGAAWRENNAGVVEAELDKGQENDLATLIFTSGTTGEPKGVMLTHGNFIAQLPDLQNRIYVHPGERIICVLPVWHAFQRACEYVILSQGGALCYSKPIGSILLKDLEALNPHIMPAVPRVYEALYDGINKAMRKTGGIVYNLFRFFTAVALLQCRMSRRMFRKTARFKNDHIILTWIVFFIPWLLLTPLKALGSKLVFSKVRAKLGTNFRAGVSGGGALPPAIDEFFWAAGVNVVEGYGLTETSPVVAVRPVDAPIFGTVGKPLDGVEVRIIGESGEVLPNGKKGVVQVRGPIVMQGYYNKPELTKKAIDEDGWFDTGDIGMKTVTGEVVIRGRMKDTIVLRGGENIEPLPIEMKMSESRFIQQSIVVGQDERFLTALIVPAEDEIKIWARENYVEYDTYENLLKKPEIIKFYKTEVQTLISTKTGFKPFEIINDFTLLVKPFEVGRELSPKQEMMRYKIFELYEKEIKAMYSDK